MLLGTARELARRGSNDTKRAAAEALVFADRSGDLFQRLNVVNQVAVLLAQMGDREAAARALDGAVGRVPDSIGAFERVYALVLKASGMAATGRAADAARLVTQAQQSIADIKTGGARDRDRALIAVSNAYANIGRYDEARAVIRDIRDTLSSAVVSVSAAMASAGEFERANAVITEFGLDCPENWPELAEAQAQIALSLAERGDGESAIRCAQGVHPTRREHTLHKVSIALAERKDFVRAIDAANQKQDEDLQSSTRVRVTSLLKQPDQLQRAVSLAEEIKTDGYKASALALIAINMVRGGERGPEIAARVHQARSLAERVVEHRLKWVALADVGLACNSVGDSCSFREVLTNALLIAAGCGRDEVFHVLWHSADAITELDRGETLWATWTSCEEIEAWWTTPRQQPSP